jgi:hypothetical protein
MKSIEKTTIDITPSWAGVLPILIAVLENPRGSAESKQSMAEELGRMAKAADLWNLHGPEMLAALEKVQANAAESPEWIRAVTEPVILKVTNP